jgi:hypothetical protein
MADFDGIGAGVDAEIGASSGEGWAESSVEGVSGLRGRISFAMTCQESAEVGSDDGGNGDMSILGQGGGRCLADKYIEGRRSRRRREKMEKKGMEKR